MSASHPEASQIDAQVTATTTAAGAREAWGNRVKTAPKGIAHLWTGYFMPLSTEFFDALNKSMASISAGECIIRMVLFALVAPLPAVLSWSLPIDGDLVTKQRGQLDVPADQLFWVALGRMLNGINCCWLFPVWFQIFVGEYKHKSVYWIVPLGCGVMSAIFSVIPCYLGEFCVVPFSDLVNSCGFMSWSPAVLYLALPPETRSTMLKKSALALGLIVAVICFFGVLYPLAAVLIYTAESTAAKMAVSFSLILLRHVFQAGALFVAKHVNPDGFPVAVFHAVCCYETFVAIVVSETRAWYIFAAFILFDVCENAWNIYCVCTVGMPSALSRNGNVHKMLAGEAGPAEGDAAPVGEKKTSLDVENSVRVSTRLSVQEALRDAPASEAKNTIEGRVFCLLSISVLIEVAEIICPAALMIVFAVVRQTKPELSSAVALLTDEEFGEMMLTLGLEVVAEVVVFVVVDIVVWRYVGLDTLRLAGSLLKVFGWPMLCVMMCAICYFTSVQYTMAGADLSFGFHWLKDAVDVHVTWHGGLCWVPDGEAPNEHNCKWVAQLAAAAGPTG